jgi:hypothetical protein
MPTAHSAATSECETNKAPLRFARHARPLLFASRRHRAWRCAAHDPPRKGLPPTAPVKPTPMQRRAPFLLALLFSTPCAHTLMCDETRVTTGLGDRLLSFWAACLYARIHDERLLSQWRANVEVDADRAYNKALLSVPPDCQLTDVNHFRPWHGCTSAIHLRSWHLSYSLGIPSLVLARAKNESRDVAAVQAWTPQAAVSEFRRIAQSTGTTAALTPFRDAKALGKATCVHLRGTDKLQDGDTNSTMNYSRKQWGRLRRRSLDILAARLKAAGALDVYVVGDDTGGVQAYMDDVAALGGQGKSVRLVHPRTPRSTRHVAGLGAYLDFFRLASCHDIILVGRFSGFSLGASLVGNSTLTIFNEGPQATEHMHSWSEVAHIQFVDLER